MGALNYKWNSGVIAAILGLLMIVGISESFAQARDYGQANSRPRVQKKTGGGFDPDRIIIGGNAGAAFGNITVVELSPSVGYLVRDDLLVGLQGRYIYYEERSRFGNFTTNIYGGGIFTQYYFLENFLAHAEYEILNLDDFRPPFERVNIQSIFVGGGYRSSLGGNSFISILLLYNLNETYNSPYTNPVLRFGFGFGL